ncbi:hypothetical protein C0J52_12773 [Blattella germanica]|nr:hypothetical protein C0J52_12773 [Blattella germanica]
MFFLNYNSPRKIIIGICWASGTLVGFLPLLGWYKPEGWKEKCYFTHVMDYNYLVFLYFFTIIAPAILLAGFYAHIYKVVLKQLRQIVTMNPGGTTGGGGTMLRMLGAARKREVKATQNLSIIVLFFIICWIPLYTINCVQAFCPGCDIPLMLTDFCIILSHINSAINPLLYAYHLRDFRAALKIFICCLFGKKEETANDTQAGRYGSHNTLHHHGVHTPSRNNSIQSLQQSRYPSIALTESTAVTSKLGTPTSIINTSINTIISSMGSIASLPLEGEGNGQSRRKRMWTLTEVPSVCEDDVSNPPTNNGLAVELRGDACGRKNEGERVSGQVNSAYIEEGIVLDYDDEDDDDVFIADNIPTLSVKDLNVQNRTSTNVTSVNFSECTDVTDINQIHLELSVRNSKSNGGCGDVLDELNLQTHSESPLIVEIDNRNKVLDDNDKTELAKTDSSKKPLIVSCDVRNLNGKDETRNSHLVRKNSSNNCYDETNKSVTSPFNQRLSPLKIVGEFLFQSSNKKTNRLKEESSIDSCKESVMTVEGAIDNSDVAQDSAEDNDNLEKSKALLTSDLTHHEDALTLPK